MTTANRKKPIRIPYWAKPLLGELVKLWLDSRKVYASPKPKSVVPFLASKQTAGRIAKGPAETGNVFVVRAEKRMAERMIMTTMASRRHPPTSQPLNIKVWDVHNGINVGY